MNGYVKTYKHKNEIKTNKLTLFRTDDEKLLKNTTKLFGLKLKT